MDHHLKKIIASIKALFRKFMFYWILFMNDMCLLFGKGVYLTCLVCFGELIYFLFLSLAFSENSLTRFSIFSLNSNPFPDSFMYLSWRFFLKIWRRICLASRFVRPCLTTSRKFSSVSTFTGLLWVLSCMDLKLWNTGRRRREMAGRRRRFLMVWEMGGEWGRGVQCLMSKSAYRITTWWDMSQFSNSVFWDKSDFK